MNKERGTNIENIENPIVKVDLIAMKASSIEDEVHLNNIIFFFNAQVPGAIHTTEEVKTLDKSYRLKIEVDKEHLEEFKTYMKEEIGEDDISFC